MVALANMREQTNPFPTPRSPANIELLEERHLLSWGPSALLISQDKAVADFPNVTGAGEVVVDIDSGFDSSHAELASKLWANPNPNGDPGFPNDIHGWNFATNTNDPTDLYNATTNPAPGHGTQTAGLVAASQYVNPGDGLTYQGIAPGVKILPLKVGDDIPAPQGASFDQAVGAALNYVVQMVENHPSYNIVAVNMSLHVAVPGDYALYEAQPIATLHSLGIFIGAASGNYGYTNAINYPAAGPGAYGVAGVYGAVGGVYGSAGYTQDTVTANSNRDSQVALLAPSAGDSILSVSDSYQFGVDGTSYATPQVTGAAALIKQIGPAFTPDQITAILQQSGTPIYDPGSNLTYKRLNLDAALKLATQLAAAPAGPVVASNPVNQVDAVGSTVTFNAQATGSPAPVVLWQVSADGGRSFTNISGANGTNYNFTATAGQNGDLFKAIFNNSMGTVTTTPASLTVSGSTTPSAPMITTQPASQSVSAGSSASFTAAASGYPAPTVQWEVSTNGGQTFNPISGAVSPTYTFTPASAQSGDEFAAIFTNSQGSATTTPVALTVSAGSTSAGPVVTSNPTNQTASVGSSVTFTAAASGTPTPIVLWQVSTDGGLDFTNIVGATSVTYSFSAAASQSGNVYRAIFNNASGTVLTSSASLIIGSGSGTTPPGMSAPVVTANPTNQSATAGSTVTFTAAATGNPTPIVLWQVSADGGQTFSNIAGATSPQYAFTAAATQSGNLYKAIFNNALGTVTTAPASLTVGSGTASSAAPTVTTNPTNQSASVGTTVTFTAAATGTPTPIVLWQFSIDGGRTFMNIAGATSPTYSFLATANQNGDLYKAIFNNPSGTVTTTPATLTVS